jgi:hypothetical protein
VTELTYEFEAVNFSSDSANPIHRDDGATDYGFRGGLVPGPGLFTYICDGLGAHLGFGTVRRSLVAARYVRPVYDGDRLTLEISPSTAQSGTYALVGKGGAPHVKGTFGPAEDLYSGSQPSLGAQAVLEEPRPLTGENLLSAEQLGSVFESIGPDDIAEFIRSLGLDASPYLERGTVPNAYLVHLATRVQLYKNFKMVGPGIHAGSETFAPGPLPIGAVVEFRTRIDRLFRRSGRSHFVSETAMHVADSSDAVAWCVQHVVYDLGAPAK